jgi:hypothetical protein
MAARAMNPKALATMAAAVALTLACTAGEGQAQGHSTSRMAPTVAMRTLMAYDDGAWTSPVAMVLKSAADWTAWNHEMVERGMAIGEEPVPAGVDWSTEAVLVVALGPGAASRVRLQNAHRVGLHIEMEAVASSGGSGAYPCHVVAMNKQLLKHVRLLNAAQCGLAEQVHAYQAGATVASANAGTPTAVAASWGEVKDAYRQ